MQIQSLNASTRETALIELSEPAESVAIIMRELRKGRFVTLRRSRVLDEPVHISKLLPQRSSRR